MRYITNAYAEGLSNDKKLISPISPEPYGERFMDFIESITKSPEEAAREAQAASRPSIPHRSSNPISSRDPNSSLDSNRRRSGSQPMNKHENEVPNSEKRSEEAERADARVISAIRTPSSERTGGLQGQILPVVEELGEASSTGGRSGQSREREENGDIMPPTPAKGRSDRRPPTPPKTLVPNNTRDDVKRPVSRGSLDKELPPLPLMTGPDKVT